MLHKYIYVILLAIKVSSDSLFKPGTEYIYDYETLVASGTGDPTPFSSVYILKGFLKIQVTEKNKIIAKFDNLKVGVYNGQWSFFPIPHMKITENEGLAPLEEPFRIIYDDGKFKTLHMNDQEPEWASNIKRGVSSFLQLELQKIDVSSLQNFQTTENTVFGDCPTNYEVLPASTTGSRKLTISKYRNHADCPDTPTRLNFSPKSFYKCSDKTSRDIMNSTAYVMYELEKEGEYLIPNKVTILSSLLYWPFTQNGPMQYSYFNMTIFLDNSSPIVVHIPSPENEEVHEDLTYIFDQSDVNEAEEEGQELKVADPFYFHHLFGETDPEVLEKTLKLLYERIQSVADSFGDADIYKDMRKFHGLSPFSFLPLVSTLDYDHLKKAYEKYHEDSKTHLKKSTHFHLFLDGLVMSGTNPSALTIRDILLKTTDSRVMNRLVLTFPLYLKNPNEALAKEMEPIFNLTLKNSISKFTRRLIELSFSNMISRACKKSLCTSSGILDKYIDHYNDKLEKGEGIDEQTTAIICLRNLHQGRALDKPLEIAQGKSSFPSNLRFQAIWALHPMLHSPQSALLREKILPVFFNRSESCEIRTTVFKLLMGGEPDRRILHEISYFMWTETCPQTLNVVRTFLHYLANTKNPCNNFAADAKTIITYLPPGGIDVIRSGVYAIDFYDHNFGFGHSTVMSVQKSGKTSLPVSVYIGLTNHLSGYASNYFGMFIRMEGLEKCLMRKLAAMKSANIEKIQNILSKLGVRNRPSDPLKLEIALLLHGKIVVYLGADEKSISEALPSLLRKLMELKGLLSLDVERSLLMMGALYEQPIEIGLPVSILTSLSATMSLNSKINFFSFLNETDAKDSFFRFQFNMFGISMINNHMPGIGTKHGIQTLRTLRLRFPMNVNFKILLGSLNRLSFETPQFDDPRIGMIHSTVRTSISADSLNKVNDEKAITLLKDSCPQCESSTVVTKGNNFRNGREIFKSSEIVKGLEGSLEYFDCERDHSRKSLLKKIYSFFNTKDKYSGIYDFSLSKIILGIQHARKYLFYSPYGATCGFKFYTAQPKSGLKLTNIEVIANFTKDKEALEKGRKSIDFQLNGKVEFTYSDKTSAAYLTNFIISHPNIDEQILYFVVNSKDYKVCLGVETMTNQLPPDPLSYEGVNDPKVSQDTRLKIGHSGENDFRSGNERPVCPVDIAEIEIKAEGFRSKEQIAEAQSQVFPYQECKNQMESEKGKFVLPTTECYLAATQQTNLKNANYSIQFKIENNGTKRWRKLGRFLNGLLSPYILEENEVANYIKDDKYYKGETQLFFDMHNHKMDVHYLGQNDVYFQGIDLSFIPSSLQHSELPARFTPMLLKGFSLGISGKCLVMSRAVNTFDDVQLSSNLPKCYTLVSGDCGENPQFLVLAKSLDNDLIGVKFMVGENYVEFDGNKFPSIDGKRLDIPEKILFTSDPTSPFSFLKNGEEMYVYALGSGLTTTVSIRYTKSFAFIVLGSSYRGVECGLCGHWDSSPYNDLALPNRNCGLAKSYSDFFSSFIVPDGSSCTTGSVSKCNS